MYGPPRLQGVLIEHGRLFWSAYDVSGLGGLGLPAEMEIRARHGPHRRVGVVRRISTVRLPERRSTVWPSRRHTSRRRRLQRTGAVAPTELNSGADLGPPPWREARSRGRCGTAQAIRASLAAKCDDDDVGMGPGAAVPFTHAAERRVGLGRIVGRGGTRAVDQLRCAEYLLPRLLIPSSFGLPPVVN